MIAGNTRSDPWDFPSTPKVVSSAVALDGTVCLGWSDESRIAVTADNITGIVSGFDVRISPPRFPVDRLAAYCTPSICA